MFISTKTGFAPTSKIEFIVEQKVIGVVITSSPRPIFKDKSAKCIAAVHEFTERAIFVFLYFLNILSNFSVTGPLPIHLDSITFFTALISLLPMSGLPNPMVCFFEIDLIFIEFLRLWNYD